MAPAPEPALNAIRASRLALIALSLAVLTLAAFVVIALGMSRAQNLAAMPSLVDVNAVAAGTALMGAPLSLLLSVLAMKARARCLNPRPRLPLVALSLSTPLVAGAICLVFLLLVLAAFDHPGS